nr:beta-phosphoglucomutase [Aestuariivivens sediminis]
MNNLGVIFDLDGVIVDTAKYHYLAWKTLADELDITFTETHNERLKGVSRESSLDILLELGLVTLSQAQRKLVLEQKNKDYLSFIAKMGPEEILPGVTPLLDLLDRLAIPYVLGSASKNAALILKQVNLFDRFKGIVDGNSVTKAKPDPEVFLLGAQLLHRSPDQCIVFEDAIAGIEAAHRAQMIAVGVGHKDTLKAADYNVNHLTEITEGFFTALISEKRTDNNESKLYKAR